MIQLVKDIKRIGDGKSVKFGALFDDEEVQDFYEALIGTLKGARKSKFHVFTLGVFFMCRCLHVHLSLLLLLSVKEQSLKQGIIQCCHVNIFFSCRRIY
mmetsp:Transcript_14848/g.32914  ORF Transcript_14848/g.32914 Transcript_14848/m.32914 type:complete len:99 (+) Transcript_14848:435-731(+)